MQQNISLIGCGKSKSSIMGKGSKEENVLYWTKYRKLLKQSEINIEKEGEEEKDDDNFFSKWRTWMYTCKLILKLKIY